MDEVTGSGMTRDDRALADQGTDVIPLLCGLVLFGAAALFLTDGILLACAWIACGSAAALSVDPGAGRAEGSELPRIARPLILGLVGFGLLLGPSTHQHMVLACVACLLLVWLRSFPARLVMVGSMVVVMAQGSVHGLLWLCLGAAVAAALSRWKLRASVVAVGLAAGLFISGPPVLESGLPTMIAMSETSAEGVAWPGTYRLDRNRPGLRYAVPAGLLFELEPCTLRLSLETGGVRDSMPLGYLVTGHSVLLISSSGEVAIPLESWSPAVDVFLDRPYSPFEHPVIYCGPARLDPGRTDGAD